MSRVPVMGALYLKPLNDQMAQTGCGYVRSMDDWVVLAPTRWKLRAAIRAVNQVMAQLRVRQHPDKTLIGRIARGFDFLGYWFSADGLAVARQTVERCVAKVSQLYEHGADAGRIGTYVRHWAWWVRAGLGGVRVHTELDASVESMITRHDSCAYHMRHHVSERLRLPFGEQDDGQILDRFEAWIIRQKAAARNLLRGRGMNGIGQFDRELGANLGGRDEDGPRNGEQFQADRWLQNLLVGPLPGDVAVPKRLHQHFGERELTRECLNLLTIHGLQQNGYAGREIGIAFQRIDKNIRIQIDGAG